MTNQETLLEALAFYNINVLSIEENSVKVQHNIEIEVEPNVTYKINK